MDYNKISKSTQQFVARTQLTVHDSYDIIIAGSGFTGSVIANLAAKDGKRVLVIEKRPNIAGNMYDYINESGILVQKYGPHSMHTNDKRVIDFLTDVWDWDEYILKARAEIEGKNTPVPFNFQTIDDYFPSEKAEKIKRDLKEVYKDRPKVPIVELLASGVESIREFAKFLFEKDYRPYTAKQWGIEPKNLDISILKRVPVQLSYVDRYFDDEWQVLPKNGFTPLFEKLLDSPNIEVRLNDDILQHLVLKEPNILFDGEILNIPVIYTGPVDELFASKYGSLPYRSLKFEFKTLDIPSYQETAGVAHPMAEGFTRITEYTKQPVQNVGGKTTICIEYPIPYASKSGNEPYYPILTDNSLALAEKYRSETKKYKNLYICGRLGNFKYYNMDEAIIAAMNVYEEV